MKKKLFLVLLVLFIGIGVTIRIWYVNTYSFKFPVEIYQTGEWVDLDGCFFETSEENTQGYSLRILSSRKISFKEYQRMYNIPDDVFLNSGMSNPDYVMDVKFEFKANESANGWIVLENYKICALDDSVMYTTSPQLVVYTVTALSEAYFLNFSIQPNSSVIVNFPFTLGYYPNGLWQDESDRKPKYLTVSNVPVQKMIELEIE